MSSVDTLLNNQTNYIDSTNASKYDVPIIERVQPNDINPVEITPEKK